MDRRRLVPLPPEATLAAAAILCPPRRRPSAYAITGDHSLGASIKLIGSMSDVAPADDRALRLPSEWRAKRRRSSWYVVEGLFLQGAIVRAIEDWYGPLRWAVSLTAHAERGQRSRHRVAVAFAKGEVVAFVSPMLDRDPVSEGEARGGR